MPLTPREQELLKLLDSYLTQLEKHQDLEPGSEEAFQLVDAAVQHWLQLAVQCCLDIGDSLLAKLGRPEPSRYRDIFAMLAGAGVINMALVRPLEKLTDFRNTIVHAYASLSPEVTWRHLREGLPSLTAFALAVDESSR